MKTILMLDIVNPLATRDFYSALGIQWHAGEETMDEFQPCDDTMGFPDLAGEINGIELNFFVTSSEITMKDQSLFLVVQASTVDEKELMLSRLKSANLYIPIETEKPYCEEVILDPNGYKVGFCSPSLHDLILREIMNPRANK